MKNEKTEIKTDKRNYRKHSDQNKALINKSLVECGAGRSVVVDKENVLIAGNGVFEEAQKLGIPCRVIESDGKELIVVKRTDLATDDEKRKLLAMADNRTSDTSEFDFDLLAKDFNIHELCNDWDFNILDFDISVDDIDGFFTEATNKEKKPHLCPHCGRDINIKPE
ncbi:MAG: hypothetical protein LBC68_08020 [Prevotellaceae bacterium]|jgi:hypothetical protein|nr:hypothetical protein [Prevotellaceae bacterium]